MINSTFKICIVIFIGFISFLSCNNDKTIKYSSKCGKYSILKHQNIIVDTVYVFDPETLKQSRIIYKEYSKSNTHIVCRDTLNDGKTIHEIGIFNDRTKLFLLAEQEIDFYPYNNRHNSSE